VALGPQPVGRPQSGQKRADAESSVPHAVQARCRDAPQCSQNLASARLSWRQRAHVIGPSRREAVANARAPVFNVAEAKARFSELLQKALTGEDVVIAKDNKPHVKLVPLKQVARRRRPGSARGRVWMARDFSAPLEDLADYR
jgi:prevent-host-death family protein